VHLEENSDEVAKIPAEVVEKGKKQCLGEVEFAKESE
jgi:hypothetical protein